MKITVTVKPSAKVPGVEKTGANHFIVSVKQPATENKANFAVLVALAAYFNVSFSRVKVLRGGTGRKKIIEIN